MEVFDPKHRVVSAVPFRDRVVHHALCEPVFDRGFIFDSYANRRGKGTHRAVARYERFRCVLRCDLYRYFPAIDHELLKRDLPRRLACGRTLELADRIVDSANPQEPVNLHFPGDGLFTPRSTTGALAGLPSSKQVSEEMSATLFHSRASGRRQFARTSASRNPGVVVAGQIAYS